MNTKQQYYKYSLVGFIVLLSVVLFVEFRPFLSGVLGAFTIYVLVRKQMRYLTDKKRLRNSLAASIILVEVILCFLIPAFLVIWLIVSRLQAFDFDMDSLIAMIQTIIDRIRDKTGYNIMSVDNFRTATGYATRIMQTVLGEVSSFGINSIVLIFVLYFMLVGNKSFESYIYGILPFKKDNKKEVLAEINIMVKSNAIGIPLLALIQGAIALIGYIIFGVPTPILFAFFTCFATIIPLIGTALVWFPLSVYFAATGNWPAAIGLALYGVLIISNIDNLVRLMLQKKMADIHPLITVFGVVIGLTLFGFWGVIFGPLLLSMYLLFFNIFKKEYLDKDC